MVKQISVFLENKEGNLAEFSRLLSENDINLRALSMAEAGEFGIVRMIVDDVYKATTSLKEADYVASVKDVLAVEIPDEAGSLAKVLAVRSVLLRYQIPRIQTGKSCAAGTHSAVRTVVTKATARKAVTRAL